jgi:HK97 family phage prohead protease
METNRDERPFDVELRQGDDGVKRLEGYAVVFGALSEDLGGFIETFEPGAFSEALREQPDVLALVNHDPNRVIGRTTNGTLQLTQDSRGLRIVAVLPATNYAEEIYTLVRERYITQMSFAFRARKGGETYLTVNGQRLRRVRNADLFDVSVVANPAYKATVVAARTLEMVAHEFESDGQEAGEIAANAQAQERQDALRRRWLQARLTGYERT